VSEPDEQPTIGKVVENLQQVLESGEEVLARVWGAPPVLAWWERARSVSP
jgi:hypothetical protein